MKRAMFAAAVVVGFGLAGISDAQAQGITIGVQGGYNYAGLSDVPTSIDSIGDKGGLVVGAFGELHFSKMWFIGVEGNYMENKSEFTDVDGTYNFKQNYIQIPAYLGVRLLSGMVQPILYAGGTAMFETTCKVDAEGFEAVDCSDPDIDVSTKSAIWGAVFGGGVNLAVGPVILTGDVRYNLGLTKISDEAGEEAKWNSWMFLVGVGLGLGN